MFAVRVTLDTGEKHFLEESYPYHTNKGFFFSGIQKATLYHNKYEFLVALETLAPKYSSGIREMLYLLRHEVKTKDVQIVKIQSFDVDTCKFKTLDVAQQIRFSKRNLRYPTNRFKALMKCFYTCSHYLYDDKGEWVAFPKNEDYDKIKKIKYYRRGLIAAIPDIFNYRNHSIPSCYSFYERQGLMWVTRDPNILKLYLDHTIDSCENFNIRECI